MAGSRWSSVALALVATAASAQSVAVTPRGVVVAHDGIIETFDARTLQRIAKTDGLEYAGEIVTDSDNLALLDPLHNKARVNNTLVTTKETPIAAAFVDHQLFILERDARTLSRGDVSLPTGADPRALRVANGRLYVYSSVDGLLQEFTASPFALARELRVAPFASDFETDGSGAYLAYPRDGMIRVVDVAAFKEMGRVRVGSVPSDLVFAGDPTALTARRLAVADPAAKRVWLIEGQQSTLQAFGRGFLRGILGLGLFRGRDSELNSGVDRVVARGSHWVAFDSSTGTLYSVTSSKTIVLGRGLSPRAFALGDGVVYLWQNGTLVAQKTDG